MLSYRHSYHAGNFADLLKHVVLVEILEYMVKKDKPFDYMDTHAGAGSFRLDSEHAEKTHEYLNGIARVWDDKSIELQPYLSLVRQANTHGRLVFYPGSPAIAAHYLRKGDRGWLFELHSTDVAILEKCFRSDHRIRVRAEDGFKGLLSLLPPVSRRALVLIDPPYEMKEDYDRVYQVVNEACRKFATGVYAIWYPVVSRQRIDVLENKFRRSGIGNIQLFELGLKQDSDEMGMTSSGMLVINPPWKLKATMDVLLPRLRNAIDQNGEAFFRSEVLVAE